MSALLPRRSRSITRPVRSSKTRIVVDGRFLSAALTASATSTGEPDRSKRGPSKAEQVLEGLWDTGSASNGDLLYPGRISTQYHPGKFIPSHLVEIRKIDVAQGRVAESAQPQTW